MFFDDAEVAQASTNESTMLYPRHKSLKGRTCNEEGESNWEGNVEFTKKEKMDLAH